MKFENLINLSGQQFRRITGVKRNTFDKMVEIVTAADKIKKAKGGRPNSLTIENRILMTLEYLREYRTYLHIAASYGISESNTFENIRWIENVLIKSKEFSLPGKKALLKSDHECAKKSAYQSVGENPTREKVSHQPGTDLHI